MTFMNRISVGVGPAADVLVGLVGPPGGASLSDGHYGRKNAVEKIPVPPL
jgi:hypothetical protein